MSNYCYNKVIIKYDDYAKYLEDYYPYGGTERKDEPYITFCKFMGDDYSETVDSAWSWVITDLNNGYMDVRFQTRRYFPIKSALTLLKLAPDTVWYMMEKSDACVSRLSVENGSISEDVYIVDNDYDHYLKYNWGDITGEPSELEKNLHEADNLIWYYIKTDDIWYRIKPRDLQVVYDDFHGFYTKTLSYNEEKQHDQIVEEIFDYPHLI